MKIFCIGRNYVEHAKELGNEIPDNPVIFMKPPTALIKNNKPFYYPEFTSDLHYEGELVVKISKNGKSIQAKFAKNYYDEVTIGFDLTARDIQVKQKEKGLPWEIAKGFDGAAPIGEFINLNEAKNNSGEIEFQITKNDDVVQLGNTALMIYSIDIIIEYLSKFYTLQKGDLIFTGTPKGVGALQIGDHMVGSIAGKKLINLNIK
jgi:2-keto-4-pentenoate hydratase/2-oxohepta-3-ene-1,7-dioic acid hydratase in catechol pathway